VRDGCIGIIARGAGVAAASASGKIKKSINRKSNSARRAFFTQVSNTPTT
jgi:hypothetical protein